ncbi:MAG: SIR2 family protein [Chryseolinea sp.]
MNHISIAIIRHKPKGKYVYLVLENGGLFSFFHRKDLAIGGGFEYTKFKELVTDYFGIPEYLDHNGTRIPVNFAARPSLFKFSKEDPYATAYTYELSTAQLSSINQSMATGTDNKWKAIRWLSEEDLPNRKWITAQHFLFERESSFNPPRLTNDYRANLRKIVEAKNSGKLVIFAGAGVSIDSGVPGWGELTQELAGDLTTDEKDFKKIAQQYYKERGENEYHQRVRQILKYEHTRFNPLHRIITEINPLHIITTNYDTHFEQVLDQWGLPFSVIRADLDLPYSKGGKLYVKIHGDFELRNIVLKKSDYDTYESKFSLIQSLVRETFASKLVLFIGFSFDDSNLRFILKTVSKILKKSIQPPYLFFNARASKKELNEDKKKLKPHNIRVLHFEEAIGEYFELVKSEEDTESLKQLSLRGQEVYKFLKVVQEFDPISDSLETMEISSQFFESLERFSELGAIPLEILVRVSPFKLKQQPKNSYRANAEISWRDPHTLETLNEEFLSFLDSLAGDERRLEFLTYEDGKASPDDQRRHRVFKLLWTSGIEAISRSGDTSASHITLSPINKSDQSCSCPRCLYTAYKIGHLFRALNSVSAQGLCEKDYNDAGLFEAYGFLKTGQLSKAFYTLEDVRR